MLSTTLEKLGNGHLIRVARLGAGPPLLLLHGYPDNLQIWSALAPRLAQRFEVIAFDWPGMGFSQPWAGGTTPTHMADRLLELMDAWGIACATLAGIDMGGQPALVCAARHPLRVNALVVMNSLVLWDEKTSWEIAVLRRFGWNRVLLNRFPRLVFERAVRTFLPPGDRLPAELREDLWTSFRTPAVRRFVARMCAGYQGTLPRLPEIYAQITCPTLLLWGGRDRHFPPSHAARLRQIIAGSRCEILPEGGHWMVWTLAEEVASRMLAWPPTASGQS